MTTHIPIPRLAKLARRNPATSSVDLKTLDDKLSQFIARLKAEDWESSEESRSTLEVAKDRKTQRTLDSAMLFL